jgi:septal ring-binding cell division protein DamX
MIALKRILLSVLLFTSLTITCYYIFQIVNPLFSDDIEKKYISLVSEYQVLKMQRLVLEQKYALEQTRKKMTHLATKSVDTVQPQMALNQKFFSSRAKLLPNQSLTIARKEIEEPVALSLEQIKTFEQLEAYVSNNKPAESQPLTRDEQHVLSTSPDAFTLQLMGVRDMNELIKFIKQNQLPDARIIHTLYLNKDWYVLVSGKYKNHTEALKAIEILPDNIKALRPWIRQLATLQKAIQLDRT